MTTSDCMMSWSQMWAYFSSDFCTDEMRCDTLHSLNLHDALSGKTSQVRNEIMQDAPDWVKELPDIKLLMNKQTSSKTNVASAQEVMRNYILRRERERT